MPIASRSLVALVVAAAAAAALIAHGTIDVIADYLVAHASYDDVPSHASRGLVVGIGAIVAQIVALHGFRLCCEAAANRTLASAPLPGWRAAPLFVGATVLLAAIAVPLMELFDSRLAGETLGGLSDAFGGSVPLGLGTTVVCAAAVGVAAFAFARWLLSHRDRIIAAIAGIIHFQAQARHTGLHRRHAFGDAPICPRRVSALRRGKRAPPADAPFDFGDIAQTLGGLPCYLFSSRRAASSAVTSTRRPARRLLAPS
ncbi:MAG TPA: hypothetical protein VJP76_00575 [Candidatus Tumulicola sp.]|nr:hypothetical protein [Candidatus Tumulicola sp.]